MLLYNVGDNELSLFKMHHHITIQPVPTKSLKKRNAPNSTNCYYHLHQTSPPAMRITLKLSFPLPAYSCIRLI